LRTRHVPLAALLLLAALALAACGGGGGGDESQIEAAIETSATTSDPANCTELETQSFAEQSSHETGKAALVTCEKEAKDPTNNAETVEVSNVEVDGSKATADAAIGGGGFDGQTVTIALVEEGGAWKLDQITGFAKLDVGVLAKAFETQFEESGELSAEQTRCIVGKVEAAARSDIEELVLTGSSAAIEADAKSCE
jgi:ABC-type glycerol-3-phosphate transport system substrate-binding protein